MSGDLNATLKSNTSAPTDFSSESVTVAGDIELYRLPDLNNQLNNLKWAENSSAQLTDVTMRGPYVQKINDSSLDDANDVIVYKATHLDRSVYILYVSSQSKRFAVESTSIEEIANYTRAFAALEKASLRSPKAELEQQNSPKLREIIKSELGRELSGKEFVELGIKIFGSWDGAVSGTCARPKTVLWALSQARATDFFGFQYYPDVDSIQLLLKFSIVDIGSKSLTLSSDPSNRGWPKTLELNWVK
jgi:hypothetical protein